MKIQDTGRVPVRDSRMAACFGACGFEIQVTPGIDFQTEESWTHWHVSPGSHENAGWNLLALIRQWKTGEVHSDHPLAVAALAIDNRRALIGWIKEGGNIRLEEESPLTFRAIRDYGHRPLRQPDMFRTVDLMVAAALVTVGTEPVTMEDTCGPGAKARLIMNRYSAPLPGGRRLDAVETARVFRSGEMAGRDPTHPFLRAMHALNCYDRILEAARDSVPILFIRGDHPTRHAYVRADCAGATMDRVRAFFNV